MKTMRSRFFLFVCLGLCALFLNSCARPSDYNGYITRSYTIRGQTYHPMSVEQALGYKETGECSWYDESSFLDSSAAPHLWGKKFNLGI